MPCNTKNGEGMHLLQSCFHTNGFMTRFVSLKDSWRAVAYALISVTVLAVMACGSGEPLAVATATPVTPRGIEATEAEEFVIEFRSFRIVPEETSASYEVEEEITFLGIPFTRTKGTTEAVEGGFSFGFDEEGGMEVTSTNISVDLRTLVSNDTRRDERIRGEFLESDAFPFAEFVGKEINDFPLGANEGAVWEFELKGDMTIRERTRSVTYDVITTLRGNRLQGTAATRLSMKDFGFDPPEIPGLFKVEDGVDVTVTFTALETGSGN